jgi:hypothetical protein
VKKLLNAVIFIGVVVTVDVRVFVRMSQHLSFILATLVELLDKDRGLFPSLNSDEDDDEDDDDDDDSKNMHLL